MKHLEKLHEAIKVEDLIEMCTRIRLSHYSILLQNMLTLIRM